MSESLDEGAGSSIDITTLNKPVAAIGIVKRRNFTMSNLVVIGAMSRVPVKKPDCQRSKHRCRMSVPGRPTFCNVRPSQIDPYLSFGPLLVKRLLSAG